MKRHASMSYQVGLGAVLLATACFAQEVDPTSLYEVSTQGSTVAVRPGEQGKFVLSILPKNGAHVSSETPLKVELSGRDLTLEKERLTFADSLSKPAPGEPYAAPRFEVPFIASKAGQASVEGKLTFFICTDKLCSRQQKSLSVPVKVK